MKRKTAIIILAFASILTGAGIHRHNLSYQDGRYLLIARDYSDARVENLIVRNTHLSKVINAELKIDLDNVTFAHDLEISNSTREQVFEHGLLEKTLIHKNILWSHHLGGKYSSSQEKLTIPLSGLYVTIACSQADHYRITRVQFKDEGPIIPLPNH